MAERDPECVRQAVAIVALERHPPTDGPTFCVDEKTGIGVRRPAAPSQPVAPARPARRELESVRNGTADLLAAFAVGAGQVTPIVRRQHRSRECCELPDRLDRQAPVGQTIHLILDPVSLHRSAEVAVWLADRPWRPFVFPWLPTHPPGAPSSKPGSPSSARSASRVPSCRTSMPPNTRSPPSSPPTTPIRPTHPPGGRGFAAISASRTSSTLRLEWPLDTIPHERDGLRVR